MNEEYSDEKILNSIRAAGTEFQSALAGSTYWRDRPTEIKHQVEINGITIRTELRDFHKPDGTPILPQTPLDSNWLVAGSYFGQMEAIISGGEVLVVHAPHNRPEDYMHIKCAGSNHKIPPSTINDYGTVASGLFLQCMQDQEAIRMIGIARRS